MAVREPPGQLRKKYPLDMLETCGIESLIIQKGMIWEDEPSVWGYFGSIWGADKATST